MMTLRLALTTVLFSSAISNPSHESILRAAHSGDSVSISRFLDQGVSANVVDEAGEDALVHLIAGWHSALDGAFPNVNIAALDRYRIALDTLLSGGADPARACPLLDAAVTSNVVALSRIAEASARALIRCATAEDINGETPVHGAAQSLAAGLARVAIRAHVLGVSAASMDAFTRGVGLEGVFPVWSHRDRTVSKSSLDAWSSAASLRVLMKAISAAERSGTAPTGSLASAATHVSGGEGDGSFLFQAASPLSYACAAGNAAAVRLLLSMPDLRGPVLRQLASSNGVNSSCAHFAVVRGFVDVLDALLEGTRDWDDNSATLYVSEAALAAQDAPLITYRPATWALLLTDGRGRNPLDLATLAGPAGVEPLAWLKTQVYVSNGSRQSAAEDAPPAPYASPTVAWSASSSDQTPWLRRFNATAHRMAGWRILDASDLIAAGLPSTLTCLGSNGSVPHCTRAAAYECVDGQGIAPLVIPESDLSNDSLLEDLFTMDVPFVVQTPVRRVAPRPGEVNDSIRYLSRRAAMAAWGNLSVDVGQIPYASTYGLASNRSSLRTFITKWMGVTQASPSRPALDNNTVPLPPYIFDAQVIQQNHYLFSSGLAFPTRLRKGSARMSQFIVGPPLSGAMPHFHGSAANLLIVGLKLWFVVDPAHAEFTQEHALEWFKRRVFTGTGTGKCGGTQAASGPGIGPELERQTRPGRPAAGSAPTPGGGGNSEPARALSASLSLSHGVSESDSEAPPLPPHYSFIQEPGDIVFVPRHWGHAVLNLADSIAIALE